MSGTWVCTQISMDHFSLFLFLFYITTQFKFFSVECLVAASEWNTSPSFFSGSIQNLALWCLYHRWNASALASMNIVLESFPLKQGNNFTLACFYELLNKVTSFISVRNGVCLESDRYRLTLLILIREFWYCSWYWCHVVTWRQSGMRFKPR